MFYYFAYIFSIYGFLFYIPSYLVEIGLSKSQINSAMSASGVFDIISRTEVGFIARLTSVNIYILIAMNECFDVLVSLM